MTIKAKDVETWDDSINMLNNLRFVSYKVQKTNIVAFEYFFSRVISSTFRKDKAAKLF